MVNIRKIISIIFHDLKIKIYNNKYKNKIKIKIEYIYIYNYRHRWENNFKDINSVC
jgi:hypothetical protein